MRQPAELVYLALGDSYTIGTGATHESRSFPSLLARKLEEATGHAVRVVNPAVNGYTTLDVMAREIPLLAEVKPHMVTVLIGVNDLVQGRGIVRYRLTLKEIYDAVAAEHLEAGRAVAISIPDWSVVPAARQFGDPSHLKHTTDSFNDAARDEASARGFTWVDIAAVSRAGMGSPGWISADGLHPGDAQYAAWAEATWSAVEPSWRSARP